jgi:hypothetical protein
MISGEVLAVVTSFERLASVDSVSGPRDARGTGLLQPVSGLSDTLDQTAAAGSPRQPHPLLLYCTVIPHPHLQSSQSFQPLAHF